MSFDRRLSPAQRVFLAWIALVVAEAAASTGALAEEPAPSTIAPTISSVAGHGFAVSALYGALLPGSIRVKGTSYDYGEGHVTRLAAGFRLVPRLALGGYVQFARSRYSDVDALYRMNALGLELVGRSNEPDRPHARVGLTFAWQHERVPTPSNAFDPVGEADGLGVGGFIEYALPARGAALLAHVGFTSQLVSMSSSVDEDAAWVPALYVGVGAELGR